MDPRQLRKIAVGLFLGLILFLVPAPEGLEPKALDVLALFVVVVFFWATEALPLPVTALMAGVGLVLLDVFDGPNETWSLFASDTIFFLLGSLILADAVTKTDTDRILAARLLHRIGGSTDSLLLGVVAVSALSASIISSHAIAAVMLPLVLSILRATGLHGRKNVAAAFMLAIAFGTGVAGIATPSAGSRNVIVLGYLQQRGLHVSYLDWMLHAFPITLALIPVVFIILKTVFRIPHERVDATALPGGDEHLDVNQRRTLYVLAATVVLWITVGDRLGLGTVAIAGAITLFVLGILDWVDTRKRVAWGVPLIYGAALAMGQALQETGGATYLAERILALDIWDGPTAIVIGTLILTGVLTNIMSDGATAAVLTPITLSVAAIAGFDLVTMGLITALGSAYSFVLVVGTPPNVITYSSGLFTTKDLAKAGLPLTVAALLVTFLAVQFYWPMLGT